MTVRAIAHVIISGRVQGVGFRAWTQAEARSRGLDGWVRNRRDGRVEALFSGNGDRVDDMVRACARGPRHAGVDRVERLDGGAPPAGQGFFVLPEA